MTLRLDIRRLRLAVLLVAAVQLGVPALAGYVDLLSESEHSEMVVHIESQDSEHCDLHHDHSVCAIASSLLLFAAPAPALHGETGAAPATTFRTSAPTLQVDQRAPDGSVRSRAPPARI